MKNPCFYRSWVLPLFLLAAVFTVGPAWSSSEDVLNKEVQRRQVMAKPLEEALVTADQLAAQGNAEQACGTLESAYRA